MSILFLWEKKRKSTRNMHMPPKHMSALSENDNNFSLSATKIPFHITFLWGQGTQCLLCIAMYMYDFVWATVYREPNTYGVVHVHKHAFIFWYRWSYHPFPKIYLFNNQHNIPTLYRAAPELSPLLLTQELVPSLARA